RGADWLDDPMNLDPGYARVRIRQLMPAMAAAGLTRERIADASRHITRARSALQAGSDALLERHAKTSKNAKSGKLEAMFDGAALTRSPREIGLRALAELLLSIGGQVYR